MDAALGFVVPFRSRPSGDVARVHEQLRLAVLKARLCVCVCACVFKKIEHARRNLEARELTSSQAGGLPPPPCVRT